MKIIRKLVGWVFLILVGFWLGTAGILDGTTVGAWMHDIVSYFPDVTQVRDFFGYENNPSHSNNSINVDSDVTDFQIILPDAEESNQTDLDYQEIRRTILDSLNDLREENGLSLLQSNEMLETAADIRAQETEESFSHTRPNGEDAHTVFEEYDIDYNYRMFGENLGMATYYANESEIAEFIFNGWVESEGHYENMMRPEYEEIGVGVHYDGEFLYATQLFGTR